MRRSPRRRRGKPKARGRPRGKRRKRQVPRKCKQGCEGRKLQRKSAREESGDEEEFDCGDKKGKDSRRRPLRRTSGRPRTTQVTEKTPPRQFQRRKSGVGSGGVPQRHSEVENTPEAPDPQETAAARRCASAAAGITKVGAYGKARRGDRPGELHHL